MTLVLDCAVEIGGNTFEVILVAEEFPLFVPPPGYTFVSSFVVGDKNIPVTLIVVPPSDPEATLGDFDYSHIDVPKLRTYLRVRPESNPGIRDTTQISDAFKKQGWKNPTLEQAQQQYPHFHFNGFGNKEA